MIEIVPADALEEEIWLTLMDLADQYPRGWTLVGAQMVVLHGLESGRDRIRASIDADVLVDVRVVPAATREFATYLDRMGFGLDGVSPEGIGHRFKRGEVAIDVLSPDGVGDRADLTTIPPARTVRVPGGSQALRRSESVEVRIAQRTGAVPRPSLAGAILVKARSVEVDDSPDAQRRDLAFLLSLVEDTEALGEELTTTERGWLRRRVEMKDRSHPAWTVLGPQRADDALAALLLIAR